MKSVIRRGNLFFMLPFSWVGRKSIATVYDKKRAIEVCAMMNEDSGDVYIYGEAKVEDAEVGQ